MKEDEILLELLRAFMTGEVPDLTENNIIWEKIYESSIMHNVFPMIYEAALRLPVFDGAKRELRQIWKRQTVASVMSQMQRTSRFLAIYRAINKEGLQVLVVKGLICRRLYEKPDHRISNDEDLYVLDRDFERCHRLFLEEGLKTDAGERLQERDVVSYYDTVTGLHIELHRQLFSEKSKAYGSFNSIFENSAENYITEIVDGIPVMTMNHTDHMLFLICHSLKHFIHSGFGIRQICDMVMFANAYGSDIDWPYIMKKLENIHGDVFWINLAAIGERYLGFSGDSSGFHPEKYGIQSKPDELLEDILAAGVFGKSSENRLHSSNITLDAYAEHGSSVGAALLKTVFPGRRYLKKRYPVLEKFPVCLPAIWLYRLINYGMKLIPGKKKYVSLTDSLTIGSKRIELMKKYGIIR